MNNSWGFEYEPDVNTPYNINRWKTGYYIVSRILEIASKGGNFLLNVGPDRHGNIPDSAVNTLRDVGEWMKIYGETVYGTEKNSLVHPFEYGYVTQKTENDGSVHWFLHVSPSYWSEGKIVVNGIADVPQSATWFDSKNPVEIQLKDNMLFLTLPKKCPNPYYATIDLHFQQPPKQFSEYPIQNNIVRLTPYQATTYYVSKNFIPYTICGWFYSYSLIEFNVFLEAGVYSLDADYACWYQDGELYFNPSCSLPPKNKKIRTKYIKFFVYLHHATDTFSYSLFAHTTRMCNRERFRGIRCFTFGHGKSKPVGDSVASGKFFRI